MVVNQSGLVATLDSAAVLATTRKTQSLPPKFEPGFLRLGSPLNKGNVTLDNRVRLAWMVHEVRPEESYVETDARKGTIRPRNILF